MHLLVNINIYIKMNGAAIKIIHADILITVLNLNTRPVRRMTGVGLEVHSYLTSVLYYVYLVWFLWVKRQGRNFNHPPQ